MTVRGKRYARLRPLGARMNASAVLLALLLPLAPLAAADGGTTESRRYVVGLWHESFDAGVCKGETGRVPGEPAVGGDCGMALRSQTPLVTVVDDRKGHVTFHYIGLDAARDDCGASGGAASPATLSLPASCVELRVFVDAGSLSGVITVTS